PKLTLVAVGRQMLCKSFGCLSFFLKHSLHFFERFLESALIGFFFHSFSPKLRKLALGEELPDKLQPILRQIRSNMFFGFAPPFFALVPACERQERFQSWCKVRVWDFIRAAKA